MLRAQKNLVQDKPTRGTGALTVNYDAGYDSRVQHTNNHAVKNIDSRQVRQTLLNPEHAENSPNLHQMWDAWRDCVACPPSADRM